MSEEDILIKARRLSAARHDGEASFGDLGMALDECAEEIDMLRQDLRRVRNRLAETLYELNGPSRR